MTAGLVVLTAFTVSIVSLSVWPMISRRPALREWLIVLVIGSVAAAFYVGIIYDLP